MDIRNFQYLVEVYRCRSISRAAQNLFISQPHLSRVIRSIEDEFGVTIFVREGGKLTAPRKANTFSSRFRNCWNSMKSSRLPNAPNPC